MHTFVSHLAERGFSSERVGIIENGTWAPSAGCKMRSMVEEMKDMNIVESTLTIKSSMKPSQEAELEEMVKEVVGDMNK
jgi:flavorubredoxin